MRKIVIPLSALLVLVAGSVAWSHGGRRETEPEGSGGRVGALVEVLGDLVEDGTITQEQSDAIVSSLEEKKAEALGDGEITKDELSELQKPGFGHMRRGARGHRGSFGADELPNPTSDTPSGGPPLLLACLGGCGGWAAGRDPLPRSTVEQPELEDLEITLVRRARVRW